MVENIRSVINRADILPEENPPSDCEYALRDDDASRYTETIALQTNRSADRTQVYNTARQFASSASHLMLATNSTPESSEKINKDVSKQIKKLKSKNAKTRYKAAEALGDMGPAANAAIPALIEAFKDKDIFVCYEAAEALSKIGESALPALIMAISDDNVQVRKCAIKAIGEFGSDAKDAIPFLINALNDLGYVRNAAIYALINMKKDAVPQLILAMAAGEVTPEDPIYVLGEIGTDAQVAVPGLIGIIKNPAKKELHNEAVTALGKIGGLAIPALVELVKKGDPDIIKLVIPAFVEFWPKGLGLEAAHYIIGLLKKELKSEDANKRIEAANYLGTLGYYSEDVVVSLEKMLESDITDEKWSAAMALMQIDNKFHAVEMPLLLKCLEINPPLPQFAITAAHALAYYKEDAKGAIPYLLEMVKWYCYMDVVEAAANALAEIGIASDEVVATLKEVIKDQSPPADKKKHHDPHFHNEMTAYKVAVALEKLTGEVSFKDQIYFWNSK